MTELCDLYDDLHREQARLFCYPIGFSPAATIEIDGEYAVFLDPAAFASLPALKAALAHELGHCATGATHRVSSPLDLISRHEYRADRWVCEHYLPPEAFRQAFESGASAGWELAEWFGLPEETVLRALHYWTERRGIRFSCPSEQ